MSDQESAYGDSFWDRGLSAPSYTRPPEYRGFRVPDVLLSGDHGRIAAWRHDQSVRRTTQRRPDLLHPSAALDDLEVRDAVPGDAGELFTLQRACWVQEQQDNPALPIAALTETFADLQRWLATDTVLVVRASGRLVGAVRARLHPGPDGDTWDIGRLMVAPDLQGRGLGRALLERIEARAPESAVVLELFTGSGSLRNQKMYKKAGYRLRGEVEPGTVALTKRRRP
jgi:tRNA (guanine37-N1)-methyltransferase